MADFNREGNEVELRSCTNYIDGSQRSVLGARLAPPGSVLFPKVGAALLCNHRRITTVAAGTAAAVIISLNVFLLAETFGLG